MNAHTTRQTSDSRTNLQTVVNIGSGRRVHLPEFLGFEEGQQVLFRRTKDGEIIITNYTNASKKIVYGVVIGREFATPTNAREKKVEKWWGIFVDENGIILGRQKSSSQEYLKKDLSCPDTNARIKLDNTCGRGLWEWPKIIGLNERAEWPKKVIEVIQEIQRQFREGNWPPIDGPTRQIV